MRIERMLVDSWMPFRGAHELALPPGPIAVVGETDGNPRRSNWSGKTALLEAITWCLFGAHRKRLDDGVINDAVDHCTVVLDLGGGVTVSRSRRRGKGTVLSVGEPGGDGSLGKVAQQRVEQLLGMGLDDYLATGCVRQGEAEALVAMQPAARREVISAWLGLGRWDLAGDRAAIEARAASERVVRARAALEASLAGAVAGDAYVELEDQLAEAARELADLRSLREAAAGELEQAREIRARAGQAAQRNGERAALRREMEQLRGELSARSRVEAEVAALEAGLSDAEVEAAESDRFSRSLRRIVNCGFDGVCPVTLGQCPAAQDVEDHVRGAAGEVEQAEAQAGRAAAARDGARGDLGKRRRELAELVRKAERYNAAARRLRELGPAEREGDPVDLGAQILEEEAASRDRRIEELVAAVAGLERDVRGEVVRAEREVGTRRELAEAERAQRVAALASRALGPRGVPARVARAGVGAVESQACALLAGTGLSLEFAWSRETQDPAPSCDDCGYAFPSRREKVCPQCQAGRGRKMADDLELLVDDGSGQAPEDARAKSGGARLLVGAAVRLAAASLLRGTRGSRVGWALVDEPFGPLDAEHREQLARTFLGMLGAAGFEQALVVSHDAALLDAAPHRLVVERRGQVSVPRVE